MQEILDAFANDAFKSLTNNGDGWTVAYDFAGQEKGTLTNAHLDKLVSDWLEKLMVMEMHEDMFDGAEAEADAWHSQYDSQYD